MAFVKMVNVRETLLTARKKCPGFSEKVYSLVEYMARRISNDVLLPEGLVRTLIFCLEDIEDEKYYFYNGVKLTNFDKEKLKQEAVHVPEIIEMLMKDDEVFIQEFRISCEKMLN